MPQNHQLKQILQQMIFMIPKITKKNAMKVKVGYVLEEEEEDVNAARLILLLMCTKKVLNHIEWQSKDTNNRQNR